MGAAALVRVSGRWTSRVLISAGQASTTTTVASSPCLRGASTSRYRDGLVYEAALSQRVDLVKLVRLVSAEAYSVSLSSYATGWMRRKYAVLLSVRNPWSVESYLVKRPVRHDPRRRQPLRPG